MTVNEIMTMLCKDIHSVAVGTIDQKGRPFTAFMDVMRADETGIYISTSKSKELYRCLNTCGYVSLSGMCCGDFFHSRMITFRGRIENLGPGLWEELLAQNDYLYRLFPKGTKTDHDVFRIFDGEGDFQDFSVMPFLKEDFFLS